MQKSIVITSIFPPTAAVTAFAKKCEDWRVIVVGDNKTPVDWQLDGVEFLPIGEQSQFGFRIEPMLPHNHYARKNIGYLVAMRAGSRVVFDTDDDNLPLSNWAVDSFSGSFLVSKPSRGFVNTYKSFTTQNIWPRGFPLERLSIADANCDLHVDATTESIEIGVWQGLANGDPDVDAIYRLTINELCDFESRQPIVLGKGTFCPFNSQNTAFRRDTFALLYLPTTVTFRFTDILRSLVAQPILQIAGYHLGFHSATVVQVRNPHAYLKDFEDEIPCYLYAQKVLDIVSPAVQRDSSIAENLLMAYERLVAAKIVAAEEMVRVKTWVSDVADCLS